MSLSMGSTSAPLPDGLVKLAQDVLSGPVSAYPGMSPDELIKYRKSDEGKALAAWAKEQFSKCRDGREKESRQWDLNLAMYNGNQWVERFGLNTGNANKLGTPRAGQVRRTINRIKPIIRTEVSKFLSQKPGASVIPATDEDEDILAAQAAEQAWESTAQRNNLEAAFQTAMWWKCWTGVGFIKVSWNAGKLDTHADVQGDIDYLAVDPYKIYLPDLNVDDIQREPYVIHAFAESTERLALRYADVLKGVELKSTCREASIEEASFAAPRKQSESDKPFDSNMLMEIWVKPGELKKLPNGGMLVFIDDTLVEAHIDGMPYDHGMYPFVYFPHIESAGFYATSIIEDLIDIQKDYNSLRSHITASRKKMGKPQILAAKGSIVASKITNEIGQVIEYKLGLPAPSPLPLMELPAYIIQESEQLLRDFEDISGQHEVSKGQTPPGVTAATAISYLQESDDSYLLPSFKTTERGYGQIARQTLLLLVQYWDVPHLIKVVGKDDTFSVSVLSGADIKGATDVRIEPGSSLPQSKAARQAFIMDLMTNGFVDPTEGLDMLDIGGTQKLMDIIKNDVRQAQRENIKFKRLTPEALMEYQMLVSQQLPEIDGDSGQELEPPLIIPVNDYDNHDVHIEQHNRFRRTQEFEQLSPEIKQLMQSHVQQHEAAKGSQAIRQMLNGMPTDGSVPGINGTVEQPASVDLSQSGGGVPTDLPSAAPTQGATNGEPEGY